jgi:hypothetical protein
MVQNNPMSCSSVKKRPKFTSLSVGFPGNKNIKCFKNNITGIIVGQLERSLLTKLAKSPRFLTIS